MLSYRVFDKGTSDFYSVGYVTPGCLVPTSICQCRSLDSAMQEADRLNAAQLIREAQMRRERELCGLGGVYPGLDQIEEYEHRDR